MTVTVVISYRRPENSGWGGRFVDQLGWVLAPDRVSIVESGTRRPEDDATVAAAAITLVVIGPSWASVDEATGRPRLDDPGDAVRQEVEQALAGAGRCVPVLVGGSALPGETELPISLQPLVALPAVQLTDEHFREDVDRLSLTVLAVNQDLRRRELYGRDAGANASVIVFFVLACLAGMLLAPLSLAAMVIALVGRRRIVRRRSRKGLVLVNLGFGFGLFCLGINLLWLGGYLT